MLSRGGRGPSPVRPRGPCLRPRAAPPPPRGGEPDDDAEEANTLAWKWTPPDLSEGSAWYNDRVRGLRRAVAGASTLTTLFEEGLQLLAHHRKNYGPEGPKFLVVLWWEWPPLHWEELRSGGSMNFMEAPEPGLLPNSDMTEEQLAIAHLFVEELIALGVYERVPPGSCHPQQLSALPGPQTRTARAVALHRQHERWRAERGVCGRPRPPLPTTGHPAPSLPRGLLDRHRRFQILPHVHHEGGRAEVYGSHSPHHRGTLVAHPFPHGVHQLPWGIGAVWGRVFSVSFGSIAPCSKGIPGINHLLSGAGFDPKLGEGRVLVADDGSPALLIWIHVDDVFLHGPTGDKVVAGLNYVMDTALRLGLICQPVKTKPPGQVQKFCGMLYDTRGTPCMRIPRSRSSGLSLSSTIFEDVVDQKLGAADTGGGYRGSAVPGPGHSREHWCHFSGTTCTRISIAPRGPRGGIGRPSISTRSPSLPGGRPSSPGGGPPSGPGCVGTPKPPTWRRSSALSATGVGPALAALSN